MIIPSKHSGYRAGIRLYPGGGGDSAGGGGGGVDPNAGEGGVTGLGTNAGGNNPAGGSGAAGFHSGPGGLFGPVNTGGLSGYTGPERFGGFDGGGYGGDNTNNNNTVVKKTQPTGTTAGTSTIDPNNPSLRAIGWEPYNQSGKYYNTLLQQGYTGNDIRNALTTQGKPISDSNYESLVQNAGMVSPTGRPMAGSDQFTQPVYNSAYQNYARPSTQFDTSLYGAQPMNSPAFNSGMSRRDINNSISNFSKANPNTDVSNTLDFMRGSGINREDFQAYGGLNNYGPQMSMPSMQAQQSFNPYTNNQQQPRFYGGQQSMGMPNPFSYNEQSNSPPRSMGLPNPTNYANQRFQQQSNYYDQGNQQSYQQPQSIEYPYQRPQQQPYNPFSYRQPPPQQQYNPYQQYEQSLGSYNPYQQQEQYNPFSYQQPQQQYNPFSYQQQDNLYQQPQPIVPTSSGPSQAIYGRSAGARGTPNVMRRAEGGIAEILKK